jgi:hypothetical protein
MYSSVAALSPWAAAPSTPALIRMPDRLLERTTDDRDADRLVALELHLVERRHAADQLRQPRLELLRSLLAVALDDRRVVLVDRDALGAPGRLLCTFIEARGP